MKLKTKIRDNHTMSLENKPTTYSSMIYLRFTRLKFSFFEVSQKISESSDFAKTSQADYECCSHLSQKFEPTTCSRRVKGSLIYFNDKLATKEWLTILK